MDRDAAIGGEQARAMVAMFPPGCECSSYGHGLTMTRVSSSTCPVHNAALRSVTDIRTTGAAWVSETELAWLCDEVERLRGERDDSEQRLHAYQQGEP